MARLRIYPCRRQTAASRPAAAIVEFAFAALFVLGPVLIGMVELGRAVMVKCILTDAARKGSATGAMSSKTYTDIYNDVDDILNTDHQLPATLSNGKATLTVTVATWDATTQTYGDDVTVTSSTFAPKQYDKVSVKIAVNATDVTWAFLKYTAGGVMSETVAMMRQ
jgi:Flp pilus assembly protein TadG